MKKIRIRKIRIRIRIKWNKLTNDQKKLLAKFLINFNKKCKLFTRNFLLKSDQFSHNFEKHLEVWR